LKKEYKKGIGRVCYLIYIINKIIKMKRIKKDSERKVKVSITISPDINKVLEEMTNNKSKYIEYALLEYFNKCGLDTSKIRIS
jgi:hypothetical protein